MNLGKAIIMQGDARQLPIDDEWVDTIITSPPYFGLREYTDDGEPVEGQVGGEPTPQEFLEALWETTAEMMRVLKPTGSIFVNLGDKFAGSGGHNNSGILPATPGMQDPKRSAPRVYNKNTQFGDVSLKAKSMMNLPARYAIGCTDKLGLIQRAEIIWAKTAPMPNSRKDAVNYGHETWFHFVKQPNYYSDIDPIREPYAKSSLGRYKGNFNQSYQMLKRGLPHWNAPKNNDKRVHAHPKGKVPSSVWSIGTAAGEMRNVPEHLTQHFAAFPMEWPIRFVQAWCPPEGRVLDPFGGTGTVAMVARALGRTGISVDLSEDYCQLARWRCFQSNHHLKVWERVQRRSIRMDAEPEMIALL
jgi:DNA modification methylase